MVAACAVRSSPCRLNQSNPINRHVTSLHSLVFIYTQELYRTSHMVRTGSATLPFGFAKCIWRPNHLVWPRRNRVLFASYKTKGVQSTRWPTSPQPSKSHPISAAIDQRVLSNQARRVRQNISSSHLLLGLGQDSVGFENVVRRGVPQAKMLTPASREETVVTGVKGYSSGREPVILSCLVDLSCR